MSQVFGFARATLFGLLAFLLVSCAEGEAPTTPVEPLGDFKLGFVVVVAKNAQMGPLSRPASTEEWEAAFKSALTKNFSGYQGDRFYHISVSVDGYVLAVPGVPIIASPKSGIVVSLNVWDDKRQVRILEENKRFTVLEAISGKSILGSGLTQSREEQIASLTRSAVNQVHQYLKANKDAFRPDSPAAPSKDS